MFLLLLNGLLKHFNQVNIITNYCVGLTNAPCLLNFQEALNEFIFVYYLIPRFIIHREREEKE